MKLKQLLNEIAINNPTSLIFYIDKFVSKADIINNIQLESHHITRVNISQGIGEASLEIIDLHPYEDHKVLEIYAYHFDSLDKLYKFESLLEINKIKYNRDYDRGVRFNFHDALNKGATFLFADGEKFIGI